MALDRTNGAVLGAVQAGGLLVAPPLVVEGVVYAVSAVAEEVAVHVADVTSTLYAIE